MHFAIRCSRRCRMLLPLAIATCLPAAGGAQSLLERPPNVSAGWTGAPGSLYFNFLHRFSAGGAPTRKVSNVPTFLLAAGLPKRVLAGLNYSTNSTLVAAFPNEWELFGRWRPLSQEHGAPLDLAAQASYNNASEGIDGELSAARRIGRVRLVAAGRSLSGVVAGSGRDLAVAGGASLRLGTFAAIAGDIATLLDRDSSDRAAWSVGLHLAIPYTPHTFSLHATNTLVTTLQGISRGSADVRYGFEFTVPFSLRRYFGNNAPAARADPARARIDTIRPPVVSPPTVVPQRQDTVRAANVGARSDTVRTGMRNTAYLHERLEITVGTTVEWTNNDALPHTVSANDESFDSGIIGPGKRWTYTFTKPGTYPFYCMPHPFMKGVIVVKAP